MSDFVDEYDEQGNLVFLVDYNGDGYYVLIRGTESNQKVVKRSRSVQDLVKHVVNNHMGDPQIVFSDACEIIWSLEVSDGTEWWLKVLDEEAD